MSQAAPCQEDSAKERREKTRHERRERIAELAERHLSGESWATLRRKVQYAWGISLWAWNRYRKAALQAIRLAVSKDPEVAIDHALATRRLILGKALANGDLRTAQSVARDESELLGQYPDKRVHVSGQVVQLILQKQVVERLPDGSVGVSGQESAQVSDGKQGTGCFPTLEAAIDQAIAEGRPVPRTESLAPHGYKSVREGVTYIDSPERRQARAEQEAQEQAELDAMDE